MTSLRVILATPCLPTLCQASSQLSMVSLLSWQSDPAFLRPPGNPGVAAQPHPCSFPVLTGVSPLCIQFPNPHHWITLQAPVQRPAGCAPVPGNPPSRLSICVSDYLSPDAMATFFQVESAQCYFLPGFADISRSLLQSQMQPWNCGFPGHHMGPGRGQPVTLLRGPTPPKSESSQEHV